jgi:hypothetical protein
MIGKDVEVARVEDIKKIMSYGVLSTPASVVDGVVKVAGRVPKAEQIVGWIK